ncbi:dynein axonemal assembly factor 6 [Pleurodeles waltl]|uniref:dynein axonemal assembly factor 6 n=1 Tax=Pleurodeles waltl TaxID=8319 RepID=UPI003709BF08
MDMDSMHSVSSLQALSKLLTLEQEGEDEQFDSKLDCSSVALAGPGDIGSSKTAPTKVTPKGECSRGNDIWDPEEVQEGSEYDDVLDHRDQPEYEIIFKQQVGAEDVFLGMSRKDPSTACCEDMLVRIKLPGTKSGDLVLDVCDMFLDLRTPKYKLGLHLPHAVDSKNGKAHFISEKETLEVTLTMRREFDFINFA